MTKLTCKQSRAEQGFTLVELAIVMIIIGLLIGGILKGQELITNARVASTVTQIKAIDVAVNTFRDSYAAFPGDIIGPTTRLPNCAASTLCVPGGSGTPGNGRIDQDLNASFANDERTAFWSQLTAADLFSGVIPGAASSTTAAFGDTHPASNLGGGYLVGNSDGTNGTLPAIYGSSRPGHHVALNNQAAIPTASTGFVEATLAERIDRKMDDGAPASGTVMAFGAAAAAAPACASAATPPVYNTVGGAGCGLYIRIQQ